MNYEPISAFQAKNAIDLWQVFDAWRSASAQYRTTYRGGMTWKTIDGVDYLVKTLDRTGGQKGLGRRSGDTEKVMIQFVEGKRRLKERVDSLAARIVEMSSVARAVRINRVPNTVTRILRLLDERGMLAKNMMVVGTNALYAYEAAAGCFIDGSLTATTDCDFLWDARSRLKLAAADVRSDGFMSLLKKADRSFAAVHPAGYSGVNKDGFIVDLIKPTPNPPWRTEATRLAPSDVLVAAEIPSLKWLLASPKFEATVIGINGMPANMVVPDPRAFAIHKLWLSQQVDREPIKKPRDRQQAFLVAGLVEKHLQHLPWRDFSVKVFPASLLPFIDELRTYAHDQRHQEDESFSPRPR